MKTYVKFYLKCGETEIIRISGNPRVIVRDLTWGKSFGLVCVGKGLRDKHHWSTKGPLFTPTWTRSLVPEGCFVAIEPYFWFFNTKSDQIHKDSDTYCERLVIETRDGNKVEKIADLIINPNTKIDGFNTETGEILYSTKEWDS